jgi:hypothetical protein
VVVVVTLFLPRALCCSAQNQCCLASPEAALLLLKLPLANGGCEE